MANNNYKSRSQRILETALNKPILFADNSSQADCDALAGKQITTNLSFLLKSKGNFTFSYSNI